MRFHMASTGVGEDNLTCRKFARKILSSRLVVIGKWAAVKFRLPCDCQALRQHSANKLRESRAAAAHEGWVLRNVWKWA
jgi:hypothetical protein